jgi:outer membrane protein assembly factor BamB
MTSALPRAALWRFWLRLGLLLPVCLAAPVRGAWRDMVEWSLLLGEPPSLGKDSSPAVAPDGSVYVGCNDGRLYCLSAAGTPRWQFRTGNEIRSSPALAEDGTVYFGSRDRHLYALTRDGNLKWRFATEWGVDSSPALGRDGTVYVGSWDRNFYALSSAGALKWKLATGGAVVAAASIGRDGTIYFGSHDGILRALDPRGQVKWTFPTQGPIISSPAIRSDNAICFTSTDGKLRLVGPDGKLRWELATGGWTESSPTVGAGDRIIVAVNNLVWAVDAAGHKLWEYDSGTLFFASTPVLTENGLIYLISRNTSIYALSAAGQLAGLWEQVLDAPTASINLLPDGALVAGGLGPRFYAFKATNALAQTAWPMFLGNRRHTSNAADHP